MEISGKEMKLVERRGNECKREEISGNEGSALVRRQVVCRPWVSSRRQVAGVSCGPWGGQVVGGSSRSRNRSRSRSRSRSRRGQVEAGGQFEPWEGSVSQ